MLYPDELRALWHYEGEGKLVGVTRFERATLCSQNRCATRLRHTPKAPDSSHTPFARQEKPLATMDSRTRKGALKMPASVLRQ